MILQLDIGQMVASICFFGVWIGIIFYYVGKRSNKVDTKKFETKILRLENKVETLQDEKAALIENNREDEEI